MIDCQLQILLVAYQIVKEPTEVLNVLDIGTYRLQLRTNRLQLLDRRGRFIFTQVIFLFIDVRGPRGNTNALSFFLILNGLETRPDY